MNAHQRIVSEEIPAHERPLSERYRVTANQWCRLDGAARMLEEKKTLELEKRKDGVIAELGPMPENKAERIVKASQDWADYVTAMVNARTAANELQHELIGIRMEEREISDRNQTIRAEMRLARS
jgi:hypothetical protein